jgi:hypothetical protein
MKKLWSKKWGKALIVFLPFTGIIEPLWWVLMLFVYFAIGGWYLFMEE